MPIQGHSSPPRRIYRWYVLAILCGLTLMSQLDRQLTSVLVAPLKKAFQISDSEFGLLHGFAFAITYAAFALPLGLLVDRANRRNIVAVAVLVWSLFTLGVAFATSFAQLVVLRLAVGIGEAVLGPAAYSLIADYFEPESRGRAVGVYYVALSTGGGLSLIIGGYLLSTLPPDGIALASQTFAPWQILFLAAGVPGLLASAIALTIKEPNREEHEASHAPSIGRTLQQIWMRRARIFRISAASSIMALIGYGSAAWMPTFAERRFGIPPGTSGPIIGWMFIVGSVTGPLLAGWLSDRWSVGRSPTARHRVLLVAAAIMFPSTFWSILPTPLLCLAVCSIMIFAISMTQSAVPLLLQEAVPADMRGQVVALQYMVLSLVGYGLGPFAVAFVTDFVLHSESLLHLSLAIVGVPLSLVGLSLCWSLVRRADLAPDS